MENLELGSKLKALRKAKNLTTIELATKVNVSQAYISKIENNKALPNLEILNKILNALDSDISTFFSSYQSKEPEDLILLFEHLKSLKPEVRIKIIELLELIK